MERLYKWSPSALLVSNGVIWSIPGINITTSGIKAMMESSNYLMLIPSALIILAGFFFMFRRIVTKNVARLKELDSKNKGEKLRLPLWNMMPLKSWLVLAFMMGLGISLKLSGIVPLWFTALFYCGLGPALAFSALRYLFEGIRY